MRGIQLAQLTAFAAVAEHRSFTRAASQLGTSTPSLSEAVRGLEERFGVRLLNRTTRSVALTEAGAQLLEHLNPVLEGVDKAIDAVNAFRDTPTGLLRLIVHPVAAATVVAPLVARFAAAYPAIQLEISVDRERKDIVSERFDAGIHFGDGVAQDMIAVPVGEKFQLTTVAAPAYLARHAVPMAPDDLRDHDCVRCRWAGEAGGTAWKFARDGRHVDVAVEGPLTVNDHELALRAALDGLGIVQLPDMWVSRYVSEGRLVPLLAGWALPPAGCSLFYPSRRHVPVKLRALIDFFRREARQAVQLAPAPRRREAVACPEETTLAAALPSRAAVCGSRIGAFA